MRPITRRVTLAILAVLVVLLALGALPSYLKSGEPYYLTATPVDAELKENQSHSQSAINASELSPRRYEYTTGALADAESKNAPGNTSRNASGNVTGVSGPYWKGPVGFKEAFANSPFDELSALRQRNASAAVDDDGGDGDGEKDGNGNSVYVIQNGTLYRLAVTQTP